jgi:cytochrome c peroxidase
MAMPSRWAVVSRLRENPAYVKAFRELYGLHLLSIRPWRPRMSDRVPTPPGVDEIYERMARAIGEFEKTRLFNKFNSKFDYVLAGMTSLSPLEAEGQALFDGKAQCNLCHISEPGVAPDGSVLPPLFTDFTYDNLGVGQNVLIPGNPQPDPGLAGNPTVAGLGKAVADGELGKHKVMSLRNIGVTAPYAHNGIFRDLQSITRFYNRRDWALEGRNGMYTCADNTDPNFGSLCFPEPEFRQNMNTDELGDLGLTESEEQALIAFMKTLTDGYPEWGQDPAVPPGTPPPFAETPLPPSP